jgi:PAS domain S-box-containing protein
MAEHSSTGPPPSEHERVRRETERVLDCHLLLNNPGNCSILILDAAGFIVTWSEGARNLYGYSEEEILGKPVSILFSREDNEIGVPERWLRTARTDGSTARDIWRVRKDGSQFCATVATNALRASDGALWGFGEIAIDIADRYRAEKGRLQQHAEREQRWQNDEKIYRALRGCLTSHIAVLDRTGTIIMVNDAWMRFARENQAPSDAAVGVGANYLDVCRRAASNCEYAARALAGLEATISGLHAEFTLEYPCHSPGVQRWFNLCATPWPVDGGAVVSHSDITQRVLAEKKLQDSEQHYRAMIENEVDIVTILDHLGNITYESPALKRILGYSPDELVGKNLFHFIHPADLATVQQAFAEVLVSLEPSRPLEFRFRHAHSGYRVVESIARNLLANPRVQGIIVNSRDITERREAEAALRKQEAALKLSHARLRALSGRLLDAEDRERRRLSRELHDDLNQALAVLAVDMGALRNALSCSPVDQIDSELRALQSRVVRLSESVRNLAYQLHPSILDDLGLAVALRSYCEEFSRREGIHVEFVHRNLDRPVAPEVATCVYRVAQEGLRNVAKYSEAKQAFVSVVGTGRYVNLTIRDTGVGFLPGSVTARRGLGLTSMTERTRLLNGTFRVISAPGKGTTLHLRVPREVHSP